MNFLSQYELVRNFWEFKGKINYVDEWFLMGSPITIPTICILYLLFVLKWGPDYMKKRSAFKLNGILVLYNILQVAYSAYIVDAGIRLLKPEKYIFLSCARDEETMRRLTSTMYLYFFAKVTELLDTIFFVLRKKQNQVTFLHVYHHTFMVLCTWLTLKYEPTYTTVFLGLVNSFVHVIMYGYYGLSAFPSLTKYLWWKKYITKMQLIQFVSVFIHAVGNYMISECKPSIYLIYTVLFNVLLFMYLFGDFYVKSYIRNRNVKAANEELKKSNSDVVYNNTLKYMNDVPQSRDGHTEMNGVRKIRQH